MATMAQPTTGRGSARRLRPAIVQSEFDKRIPENGEAERCILAAILIENAYMNVAQENLGAEDFFHVPHQTIYHAMSAMHGRSEPIDLVTLAEELNRQGKLEGVGGAPYLASLADGMARVSNVAHYAEIVREKSLLRRGLYLADALRAQFMLGEEPATKIFARGIESLKAVEPQDRNSSIQIFTSPQLAALTSTEVNHFAYPVAFPGTITSLEGPPKLSGKTTLLLTAICACFRQELFLNLSTQRVPVLYVSEESPRTLRLNFERAGLAAMENLHIYPSSLSLLTWPQKAQFIELFCVDHEIRWLVVDTFSSVVGLTGEEENRSGAIDEAIGPLRYIAGKLDVAVTIVRHSRKAGGQIGESGRGSSALSGAVDTIVELKRLCGNHRTNQRQIEIVGRLEQAKHTIELCHGKYVVVPEGEEGATEGDPYERLQAAVLANPVASVRELERSTGIGRNRIRKLLAKQGWLYADGWKKGDE